MNLYELAELIVYLRNQPQKDTELITFYENKYIELKNQVRQKIDNILADHFKTQK